MDKLLITAKRISQNKNFKVGLPFLLFMIGGPFILREFNSLRYEFRRSEVLTQEQLKQLGIEKKPPSEVTLEKIYEKMQEVDIDNWQNIRGPRPWEDNTEFEELKRRNLEAKIKKEQ